VGRGPLRLSDEHPPALDDGSQPGRLDGDRDEQDTDAGEQHREPGRDQRQDRREGEGADDQAQDDGAVGVPGLGMDRRQQEGPQRRTRDPRSSE
jgi:hypothetical protein